MLVAFARGQHSDRGVALGLGPMRSVGRQIQTVAGAKHPGFVSDTKGDLTETADDGRGQTNLINVLTKFPVYMIDI